MHRLTIFGTSALSVLAPGGHDRREEAGMQTGERSELDEQLARWVTAVDSTGRALVVATEGPSRPRVLVPDLAVAYGPSVAWWQPAG